MSFKTPTWPQAPFVIGKQKTTFTDSLNAIREDFWEYIKLNEITSMETRKIFELSNEELLKKKKTTRFATGMLIGVLGSLFVLNLINIINGKQNWGAIIVPVALMPIVFTSYKSLKEIEKELKLRNVS